MPSTTNSSYRKLSGSGFSLVQSHRLWLGEDHLLLVASSVIGERYRRFYFADIQAIVWRTTALRWVRVGVWLFLAAVCAVVAGLGDGGLRISFGAIGAFFVLATFVDILLGKTCACFVQTAVQFERLPSLSRERSARKMRARLQPLIVQAQGTNSNTVATPAAEPAAS